jgi:hypothetical protein
MPEHPPTTPPPPTGLPVPAGQRHAAAASPLRIALGLSKGRLALAFAIAGVSDLLSAFVIPAPPLAWVVDLVTATLLFVVLGWQWLLLPGLILEAIPGVSVLPFWSLVVGAIAVWGTARPKFKK